MLEMSRKGKILAPWSHFRMKRMVWEERQKKETTFTILGCPLLFYQTRIWIKIKIISVNSTLTYIFYAAKWSSRTCEQLEKKSLFCNTADVLVLRLKWRHIHSRLSDLNLMPSLTEITLAHRTQLLWTNEDKILCHTQESISMRVICFENAVLNR